MKYCLSSRQDKETLSYADEIRIEMRDWRSVIDYLVEYPNARILLDIDSIPPDDTFDWNIIKTYNEQFPNRLTLILKNLLMYDDCKKNGFNCIWTYPITTFFELNNLRALGINECYLSMPLFFQLDKLKVYHFKFRVYPHIAYQPYILSHSPQHGTWIRPEDTDIYDEYLTTFEFFGQTLEEDSRTFKIYKSKIWEGRIDMLIKNLPITTNNAFVAEEILPARLVCGQRCESGGACRICDRALKFGNTVKKYLEQKKKKSI